MELTLVVCDNLNLAALHDTNAGVGSSQIDTNDRAHDGLGVIFERLLVLLCVGRLGQHQAANEDEEKVESNRPCRPLAGAPRASRHYVCEVVVFKRLKWPRMAGAGCGRHSLGARCAVEGRKEKPRVSSRGKAEGGPAVEGKVIVEEGRKRAVEGWRYMETSPQTIRIEQLAISTFCPKAV